MVNIDEWMILNYNIPRKIRELQSPLFPLVQSSYYNIPRKIRELQFKSYWLGALWIITYQEKLGNYNNCTDERRSGYIITYQEKLGNYNKTYHSSEFFEL